MADGTLRYHLRTADPDLHHRFQAISLHLRSLLEYSQGGGGLRFTPHGISHIGRLEASYDWLLSHEDIADFNATEAFVLLVATYSHDLLMIPRKAGDEDRARETHAESVADFLINSRQIDVSDHEARAIGEVVRGHSLDDFGELQPEAVLGSQIVRQQMLAACLSVADICDADDRRAPRIVFDYLSLDETSAAHWRRHLQIAGVTRKGEKLLMSAYCYSDEGEEAVREYVGAIEQQLRIVRPYFDTELARIEEVELLLERQRSAVDTPISFGADVPAILQLLIEGVYQDDNVFVRELVQNALDANYLAQAQAFKRGRRHDPQIVVSCLETSAADVAAVRVDDNGIGMSIREVRDTLLTIAATQANTAEVEHILEGTGRSLIATFGIGLLSCLKVAEKITVRTAREDDVPLEFDLTGVEAQVSPREAPTDLIGTTIIVWLRHDRHGAIDAFEALHHYCVAVSQADLFYSETSDASAFTQQSRSSLFADAESGELERIEPQETEQHHFRWAFGGADVFDGALWIDNTRALASIRQLDPGRLMILNEGVLVTEEASDEWLPEHIAVFDGFVNFRAGSLNLSASRDAVRKDEISRARRREVGARSSGIVEFLARATNTRPAENTITQPLTATIGSYGHVIILCAMLELLREQKMDVTRFVNQLDHYTVNRFGGGKISLGHAASRGGERKYVAYGSGNTVSSIGTFSGQAIYHDTDVDVVVEAELLSDRSEDVLLVSNFTMSPPLNEVGLVRSYFSSIGQSLIDISEEHPMTGQVRSKGISSSARSSLGANVKFVEVPTAAGRPGWRVGEEIWVNVANPKVAGLYRLLTRHNVREEELRQARVAVLLIGSRFEEALEQVLSSLTPTAAE